jgi:hypothetical protein
MTLAQQSLHQLLPALLLAFFSSSTSVGFRDEQLAKSGAARGCTRCHEDAHQHQHYPPPDAGLFVPGPRTVPFLATIPVAGVDISSNALLAPAMETNSDYLLTSFDVAHMLHPFRVRAGVPNSSDTGRRAPIPMWDNDLKGANAGRFLMGAGNTLRWTHDPQLRTMLDAVVDGIDACKNQSTGYMLPFDPPGFAHAEQGDYARSWLTQGLIEAGKSGNSKAFALVRSLYDWFNDPRKNIYQPYLYDGIANAEQGQIASTRVYFESPGAKWADMQVAQDVYRDNVWMRALIARDPTAISKYHMPQPNHPHCYEMTSFMAMFDSYRATGNQTWLAAAEGGWEMIYRNFTHIDGSSALREGGDWPAGSYRIAPGTGTGETCCTTFWIKFNQRFQLLHPEREVYAANIETAIYNALLRAQQPRALVEETARRRPTEEERSQQVCARRCSSSSIYPYGSTGRLSSLLLITQTPACAYVQVMQSGQKKGSVEQKAAWLAAQVEADKDDMLPRA